MTKNSSLDTSTIKLYCGIDLSFTETGLVIIDSNNKILLQTLIKTKPIDSTEDRILFIYKTFKEERDKVLKLCKLREKRRNHVKHVITDVSYGIEGVAFGSRGQRAIQQGALHYYFRIRLRNHVPTIIPPTTVKKYVSEYGKATKSLILLQIYKRWGVEFTNDNLGDAYGLCQYIKDPTNIRT